MPATGTNCGGPSKFGVNARPALQRHRRRLRNRVLDRRGLRLRRARDGGQHGTGERRRRNLGEVRGQRVARHERPRPGESPRPRNQRPARSDVVVVVRGVDQHVARRIRCPQELRADDGNEVGLALEHDELGGRLRRVDRPERRWRATASGSPWRLRSGDRPCCYLASSAAIAFSPCANGWPGDDCVHGPSIELADSQPS